MTRSTPRAISSALTGLALGVLVTAAAPITRFLLTLVPNKGGRPAAPSSTTTTKE